MSRLPSAFPARRFPRAACVTIACMALTLAGMPSRSGEQIYRSVDKDGRPVFSDQGQPGGEAIALPPTNTVPSTTPPPPANTSRDESPYYTALFISSPANDESYVNTGGTFPVSVEATPPLREGDRFELLVDDTPYGEPQPDTQFTVTGFLHGTHTLQVQVRDAKGAIVAQSDTVSVHMHQTNSRTRNLQHRRTN